MVFPRDCLDPPWAFSTYLLCATTPAYAYEWPDGDRDKLLIRLVFPRTLSMEGEGRISLLSRCRQEIRE